MKYKTNATRILLCVSLALLISACGNKSNTQEKEVNPIPSVDLNVTVPIEPPVVVKSTIVLQICSDVSDDAQTKIESGDTLTRDETNTSVRLSYNEDYTKYVCVMHGEASILR